MESKIFGIIPTNPGKLQRMIQRTQRAIGMENWDITHVGIVKGDIGLEMTWPLGREIASVTNLYSDCILLYSKLKIDHPASLWGAGVACIVNHPYALGQLPACLLHWLFDINAYKWVPKWLRWLFRHCSEGVFRSFTVCGRLKSEKIPPDFILPAYFFQSEKWEIEIEP